MYKINLINGDDDSVYIAFFLRCLAFKIRTCKL